MQAYALFWLKQMLICGIFAPIKVDRYKYDKYLVCTFSWKENRYYTIPKCLIWGFMCNNKSSIEIEDLED